MASYIEILQNAGHSPYSIGKCKAAKILGINESKAGRVLKKWRNSPSEDVGLGGNESMTESQEFSGDSWNVTLPKTRIHTLEALLEHFKVDQKVWEVASWKANKWEVGARGDDGKIKVEPLYQVKATFRRVKTLNLEWAKAEVEALKEEAKRSIKAPAYIKYPSKSKGTCLEISIYDAHFGRMSWGDETLWENYDLNIAESDYDKAVDTLLSRADLSNVEQICYVIGNDIIHFDNQQNTTTRGTIQDVDGRFQKVFLKTRKTVQRQIEKLRQIAPVDTIFVPGNHDTLSTWHLGDSIECLYGNSKDVTVLNDPAPRKYFTYGQNLIMYCHGDKGNKKNYPMIMATERPELWANSRFREIHLGHYHHQVMDAGSVIVRIIPALCPPDFWHSSQGYVGAMRGAQAFLWDAWEGLLGTVEYSMDSLAERNK